MAVTTRFVEYAVSAAGAIGLGGATVSGLGTRKGYSADSSVSDSFDIGSANNRLHVNMGQGDTYITLTSGTDLDPRFVARDIAEKFHTKGGHTCYDYAQCDWKNNGFELYSGELGSSSAVTVISGASTAHLELGWGTGSHVGGAASGNTYPGAITVSGTYNGFFDEIYKIVINKEVTIGTPSAGGGNSFTGNIYTGGMFNNPGSSSITYSLAINADSGKTTMGAGKGNCPTLSWTSGGADGSGSIELLYIDYYYHIGTKGLMVRFSDGVFNTVDPAWTIVCTDSHYTDGSNTQNSTGNALYVWGSSRADDASVASVTSASSYTALGTRGVYIKFTDGVNNFLAGDEFYVICIPPQPTGATTNLSYGNVTVSTESPVKSVMFEILSGDAVQLSTVKFGLQSHGTFSHHGEGDADTHFRFGTVGPDNTATSPVGGEWRANVTASDISDGADVPPGYLYAIDHSLAVAVDADASEAVGSTNIMGMTSDPIWVNIKLGASETGSNSLICLRLYFDYS